MPGWIVDAGKERMPVKDRFIAYGMAEPFIADLNALVETLGQAIQSRETSREQRAVAQKGVAAALSSGLAAVPTLDVIVSNQLGDDADAIAAWEHARKTERLRRPLTRPGSVVGPPSSSTVIVSPAAPVPSAPAVTPPSA